MIVMGATFAVPKDEDEKLMDLGRIQRALTTTVQRYYIILFLFYALMSDKGRTMR